MLRQPRTSRLSILALLLSVFPIVACVLLILAALAFPSFFSPPPGWSSDLLSASSGLFWIVGIVSWILVPAPVVVAVISLVRIARRGDELKGAIFAWIAIAVSSTFVVCGLGSILAAVPLALLGGGG